MAIVFARLLARRKCEVLTGRRRPVSEQDSPRPQAWTPQPLDALIAIGNPAAMK